MVLLKMIETFALTKWKRKREAAAMRSESAYLNVFKVRKMRSINDIENER